MRLDTRRASGFGLLLALLALWQASALWWVSSSNWPPVSSTRLWPRLCTLLPVPTAVSA